jgi:hypothetical protein
MEETQRRDDFLELPDTTRTHSIIRVSALQTLAGRKLVRVRNSGVCRYVDMFNYYRNECAKSFPKRLDFNFVKVHQDQVVVPVMKFTHGSKKPRRFPTQSTGTTYNAFPR